MKAIRAHFKAVIIAVLLLAIILCSAVLYTMETGRMPFAQAGTSPRVQTASEVVATPVNAVTYVPAKTPISTFTVTVDNITDFVYTPNCSVEDLMTAIGFTLGENDIVEPSLDTMLSSGAVINVTTTSYTEVVETITVPFETEYVEDDELYEDEEEIEQYGITGITVNTYEVKRHRRKVESKILLETVEESAPQTQIVRYGTMAYEAEEDEEESPAPVEDEEADSEEDFGEDEDTPEESEATGEDKAASEDEEESSEAKEESSDEAEDTEDAEGTEETQPDSEEAEEQESTETTITFANDYQRYAYEKCIAREWTEDDYNNLVSLWNRESGWNPYAENPWTGAYGIPQALPGNKMSSHGDDWATNGYVQVDWGLDYIAGRYGTPSSAWDYFCTYGWY